MTGGDNLYAPLDYAATLAKLTDLVGREVLVELRVGSLEALPPRREVCWSAPPQASRSSRHGAPTVMISRPHARHWGFLAVREEDFVRGEWHAGTDEGQPSAQPRLNITFADSVLHVAIPSDTTPRPGDGHEAGLPERGE